MPLFLSHCDCSRRENAPKVASFLSLRWRKNGDDCGRTGNVEKNTKVDQSRKRVFAAIFSVKMRENRTIPEILQLLKKGKRMVQEPRLDILHKKDTNNFSVDK